MGLSIPDPLAALDEARGIFDRSQDLTLAIEEEFQIVDPETLGLVNRFAELKARTDAMPLGEHTAGELISSEIEVKTGRSETFPEAARKLIEHRRALLDDADALGIALAACATSPGGTTRSGSTSTSACTGPTGPWRSRTRCARCCPTCSRSRPRRRGT